VFFSLIITFNFAFFSATIDKGVLN